jgi:mannose-6-phosphate isomerase-like protein (cupin superfamily)
MTPTWLIDSSSCYASGKPEALFNFHIKRDTTVWHSHADTDEVFMLDGRMRIELRDGGVDLGPGEMFVVPKGVEHKPSAPDECRILLVEPSGVVNTGEAGGAMTAPIDVWI